MFAGIGGAALGMQEAEQEWRGIRGRYVTLAGIDVDPEACRDFEMFTGAPAVQMDLFGRDDYRAFHGKEPPKEWREAKPADIQAATGGIAPDVIFTSPPCKGFSGLLPSKNANSEKYQALNRLTLRGLRLALDAFRDDLPGIILLENVPRITSRGADLLREIKQLLGVHGYLLHEGYHDCGEIGGLGQRRRRYLLIARLPSKVNAFVYQPPKQRVRSIGEIIGPLPLPDNPAGGAMHRLPRLQWKTWVRLALIPAGGDWRNLEHITPEQYSLEYVPRGGGPYGVQDWECAANTVIGHAKVRGSNGAAVADPRVRDGIQYHNGAYRICPWCTTAPTVTGGSPATSSGKCITDPRLQHCPREGVYRVQRFDEPSTTVTGASRVNTSNGAACVSDPRLPDRDNRHPGVYQIMRFDGSGPCVTGTRFGSGAPAVADPRVGGGFSNKRKVHAWDKPAGTVTGTSDIQAGAPSIADPRLNPRNSRRSNSYTVRSWDNPALTITGEDSLGSGAQSIADPRIPFNNIFKVTAWDGTPGAVTSGSGQTGITVADPRLAINPNGHHNLLRVTPWVNPANTITSASRPTAGAISIGDPRLGCNCRNGLYGVQAWDEPGYTVTGARNLHSGTTSVADHRIPADTEQGVWIIIAEDGTWHRPLTTWELMALQGFPLLMPDGSPVILAGKADARWRERIGNAVPPPAAQAIGDAILQALLPSQVGAWVMGSTAIWVRPNRQLYADSV
ncbi:MAG: DNA cytosine methyltransferase [Desulforudis sp.]|nr:MAG: DNA cytosine methyltransferase [Desulforudis sp.]